VSTRGLILPSGRITLPSVKALTTTPTIPHRPHPAHQPKVDVHRYFRITAEKMEVTTE
jgi:hypothetical protein